MNIGISNSKGKVIVAISGHCDPVDIHWLHNLTKPIFEDNYLIS